MLTLSMLVLFAALPRGADAPKQLIAHR